MRTAVGYCGGSQSNPTYRKVCSDPDFADYAEAVWIDFDPKLTSYEALLDAFFRSHDHISSSRSRQYASIIFTHDNNQAATARKCLAAVPRSSTVIEPAQPFWDAEPYHQKWLLQRKRDLFMSLCMEDVSELFGRPATVLNAVAAGKLPAHVAQERMDELFEQGHMRAAAHGSVRAILDRP